MEEKSVLEQSEKSIAEQPVIEKGINLAIQELERTINKNIGNSGLPVSIVRLILNDILFTIRPIEEAQVIKEAQTYSNAISEKKNVQNRKIEGKE